MKLNRRSAALVAGLSFLAAGCNRSMSGAAPTFLAAPPLLPATTQTSVATAAAPLPAPTSAAGVGVTPAPERRDCLDSATFLEDVTIPDGSIFAPGETFVKIWSVRNSGSCDWGPDHRLVSLGDRVLGGPSEIGLYPARAGAAAEWRLDLQAPPVPGEYLARWQARSPDGTRFGDEVFVLIFVRLPPATPTPAPTPTP